MKLKSFLVTTIIVFLPIMVEAQHLLFKGISMGQNYRVFEERMYSDGFQKTYGDRNPVDTYEYRQIYTGGSYWNFEDVRVYIDSYSDGKTYHIMLDEVIASPSQFKSYMLQMDKKYGPHKMSNDVNSLYYYSPTKYVWKTKKGNIELVKYGDFKANGYWVLQIDYFDFPEVNKRTKKNNRRNEDL